MESQKHLKESCGSVRTPKGKNKRTANMGPPKRYDGPQQKTIKVFSGLSYSMPAIRSFTHSGALSKLEPGGAQTLCGARTILQDEREAREILHGGTFIFLTLL